MLQVLNSVEHQTASGDEPMNSTTCISEQVLNCPHLYELSEIMYQYDVYAIEGIDVLALVNIFLHMLSVHNDDQQFETIKKIFNHHCDINQCKIFQNIIQKRDYNNSYVHHILGKVHCYYHHSHDTGSRLTDKEKLSITSANDVNHEFKEHEMINNQITILNRILVTKHTFNTNRARKYNDFSVSELFKNDKMYNVGVEFQYGYAHEVIVNDDNYFPVKAKYLNLKEELLQNKITTVSKGIFDIEIRKAQVHYKSDYRKSKYKDIALQQILSLLFYCNCNNLQFSFSKTYRERQNEHNNFYHLGKSIKIAIHHFGTKIIDGDIKVFYHGISETLLFPQMILRIDSPTSTSNQFEVAMNFTNTNNGLIVKFYDFHSSVKYFSLAWLSDYTYESEHLFIHNQAALQIKNIVHPKSGSEFKDVIQICNIMDQLLRGQIATASDHQRRLIVKCFHHQLVTLDPNKYKSFDSLHNYARNMVRIHCKRKKKVVIDSNLITTYPKIFKLLFDSQIGSINIQNIHGLFPNIGYIVIRNISLCSDTMDCILSALHEIGSDSKLNKIRILANRCSKPNMKIIEQYEKLFNKCCFICRIDKQNNNWLSIIKKPTFKLTLPESDLDGYDSSRSVSVSSNCSSIIEVSYGHNDKINTYYSYDANNNEINLSSISTSIMGTYMESMPVEQSQSSSQYQNKTESHIKAVHFNEEKMELDNTSQTKGSYIDGYRHRVSTGYSYSAYPYSPNNISITTNTPVSIVQSHTTKDNNLFHFASIEQHQKLDEKQSKSSMDSKLDNNKNTKGKNKRKKRYKLFG